MSTFYFLSVEICVTESFSRLLLFFNDRLVMEKNRLQCTLCNHALKVRSQYGAGKMRPSPFKMNETRTIYYSIERKQKKKKGRFNACLAYGQKLIHIENEMEPKGMKR